MGIRKTALVTGTLLGAIADRGSGCQTGHQFPFPAPVFHTGNRDVLPGLHTGPSPEQGKRIAVGDF